MVEGAGERPLGLQASEVERRVQRGRLEDIRQRLGRLDIEQRGGCGRALADAPLLQARRRRQQRLGQHGGRTRDVDAGVRDLAGQDRERAEVVVVCVRDDDVVDGAALDQLERRERVVAILVGVHPGVEDEAGAAELDVVARGRDLVGVAEGEVLHAGGRVRRSETVSLPTRRGERFEILAGSDQGGVVGGRDEGRCVVPVSSVPPPRRTHRLASVVSRPIAARNGEPGVVTRAATPRPRPATTATRQTGRTAPHR